MKGWVLSALSNAARVTRGRYCFAEYVIVLQNRSLRENLFCPHLRCPPTLVHRN